jgi:hypothetical protein
MRRRTFPVLLTISRWTLGGIFVFASLDKIWMPHKFALVIYNYRILPLFLLYPIANLLPYVEFLAGGLLMGNRGTKLANRIILSLLLIFTLLIIISIFRGLDISCGCFSLDGNGLKTTWVKVMENFGIILLSIFIEWRVTRQPKSNSS